MIKPVIYNKHHTFQTHISKHKNKDLITIPDSLNQILIFFIITY